MADFSPQSHEPVGVRVDDANALLTITWADDHVTALPYAYLRGLCPCAVCQGHGGDLTFIEPPAGEPGKLADVLEVGHYALNMVWQDDHRTGIYALTYLRSLCLCPDCQSHMGPAHGLHRLPAAARAACLAKVAEAQSA